MPREPIRLLTISRSFGSGGGEIGRLLAERLGWRLVGREVVREVARRLRVPEEEVASRDEHVAGLAERVGAYLADAFPEMLLPPMPPPRVDHVTVRILVESILLEAAKSPPLIVVGHGGQYLFRERPDAFHVHVYAPLDFRVEAVMRRLGLDAEAARAEVRRQDQERQEYLRRHYGIDWSDPLLYGLMINTARVSHEEAADLLASLIRASGATDGSSHR